MSEKLRWTLREAAQELGVTAGYLRQIVKPENLEKRLATHELREFQPIVYTTPTGYMYLLDRENLERLRKWLSKKPEGHKFRRVSKS